jgi:hypothetical protein
MAANVTARKLGGIIEHTVDIHEPPEEVFDYCSDLTREHEWNPKLKHVEKLSDGPAGVGTRYRADFISGDPMTIEYVQFDRPTAWATVGDSHRLQVSFTGEVRPTAGGAHPPRNADGPAAAGLAALCNAALAPVHAVTAEAERVRHQGGAGDMKEIMIRPAVLRIVVALALAIGLGHTVRFAVGVPKVVRWWPTLAG